ncbi:hypothetical protein IQ247_06790 [Plectonema cf. radiosum LEGE 06105]|uniref:Resolvase HTH domain-containing protein n=1 Tax=Plectonema cf. radiosum LEGE 06105 TaxID=945769 RepID=A0A8J7F6M9_9CYAN|nr:hypothetical protein [Plectonema radiosum]MBE9212419.1 hypothetical protein [Plectonema cf. radiosum LEGE 06105]
MDERLEKLIQEVCCYEEGTPQRQKALNNLLIIVQQLPGIYKSYHPDYLEALNQTWEWFCRNIDKFQLNPDQPLQNSLVKWINGYLKWRVKDLFIADGNYTISLDKPIGKDEGKEVTGLDMLPDPQFSSITLDLLDIKIAEIQQRDRETWGKRIIQFIEKDENQQLRRCFTRVNTDCHCQLLAKRLLLANPSHKIADIAREFNVSNQTLYSHWKKKCLPLLKEIGVNLRID